MRTISPALLALQRLYHWEHTQPGQIALVQPRRSGSAGGPGRHTKPGGRRAYRAVALARVMGQKKYMKMTPSAYPSSASCYQI